jgi:Cdc6-like AAA superfamily ATPase
MPCYCDTPDEKDQTEIERRCKVNMYFDAQSLLTREQACECEKLEIKQFPIGDVNSHLCKLCKVLTKDQMSQVSAYYYQIKWEHKTLYDWYVKHCEDDREHNK